jgi:hypothetical protein
MAEKAGASGAVTSTHTLDHCKKQDALFSLPLSERLLRQLHQPDL